MEAEVDAPYKVSITVHRLERGTSLLLSQNAPQNSDEKDKKTNKLGGGGGEKQSYSFYTFVRVANCSVQPLIGSTDNAPIVNDIVTWNASFKDNKLCNLNDAILLMELFRFDNVSCEKILLGTMNMPLSQLILDSKFQRKFSLVSTSGGRKTSELLVATILIEKRSPEFALKLAPSSTYVPNTTPLLEVEEIAAARKKNERSRENIEILSQWSLSDVRDDKVETIKDTLLEFKGAINAGTTDPFYIDDLLEECASLLDDDDNSLFGPAQESQVCRGKMLISDYVFNSNLEMSGSYYYDFKQYPYTRVRYKPLDFFGVQIVLNQDPCFVEGSSIPNVLPVYSIMMRNKYSLWSFWRFLMVAFDFWNKRVSLVDLPTWLSERGDMNDIVEISLAKITPTTNELKDSYYKSSDNFSLPIKARIVVSLENPFTITLKDVDVRLDLYKIDQELNLNHLQGIHLSADYCPPTSHILEMQVVTILKSEDVSDVISEATEGSMLYSPASNPELKTTSIFKAVDKELGKTLEFVQKHLNGRLSKRLRGINKLSDELISNVQSTSVFYENLTQNSIKDNIDKLNKVIGLKAKDPSEEDKVAKVKAQRRESAITQKIKSVPVPVASGSDCSAGGDVKHFYHTRRDLHLNNFKNPTYLNSMLHCNLEDESLEVEMSLGVIGLNNTSVRSADDNVWFVLVKRGADRHIGIIPRSMDDLDKTSNIITIGMNLDSIVNNLSRDGLVTDKPKPDEPIDVFLLSGSKHTNGFVTGYQQIPSDYLNSLRESCNSRKTVDRFIKLKLNSRLQFEITFMEIEGIRALHGISNFMVLNKIFFECDFVGHYGREIPGTKYVRSDMTDYAKKRHVFKDSYNVLLTDDFGSCAAQYVRIKVCLGNPISYHQVIGYVFVPLDDFIATDNKPSGTVAEKGATDGAVSKPGGADTTSKPHFKGLGLGAKFLNHFNKKNSSIDSNIDSNSIGGGSKIQESVPFRPQAPKESKVYSVCRYGNRLEGTGGERGLENIGEIKLNLRRIILDRVEEEKAGFMDQMGKVMGQKKKEIENPHVLFSKINLRTSSIFSSFWQADCLDASTENYGENSEIMHVYPYYTYLALFDDASRIYACNSESDWSNIENLVENEVDTIDPNDLVAVAELLAKKKGENVSRVVEVEVYENQRRSFFFPYEFGDGNLTPLERKQFSDETGAVTFDISSINSMSPPFGFEWTDNWTFDREYTTTDQFGWTYGLKFTTLRRSYRKGKSDADANGFGNAVRRRKWVRRAISINGGADSKNSGDNENVEYTWRDLVYFKHPNKVFGYCKEKRTSLSPVLIPWKCVESATVVTPSILSIRAVIHQYFGPGIFNKWGPLSVDIYVQSCPAQKLKELIYSRIELSDIRTNLNKAVLERHDSKSVRRWIRYGSDNKTPVSVVHSQESQVLSQIHYAKTELEDNLSTGSMRIKSGFFISDALNQSSNNQKKRELSNLQQFSLCRLKLYSYIVIMSGAVCNHNYGVEDVSCVYREDLKLASKITNTEDKVTFLMDVLEMRLLDCVIAGWPRRNHATFKSCVEFFINYYFIEIINTFILALKTTYQSASDIDKRLRLIPIYLKNSDRFSKIVHDSLNLFGVKIDPSPILSNFLKFQTLLDAICAVLQTDMKAVLVLSRQDVRVTKMTKIETNNYIADCHAYLQRLSKLPVCSTSSIPPDLSVAKSARLLISSLTPEEISKQLERSLLFVKQEKIEDKFPLLKEIMVGFYNKLSVFHIESFRIMALEYSKQIKSSANPDIARSALDPADIDAWYNIMDWLLSVINDIHRTFRTGLIEGTIVRLDLLMAADSPYASSPFSNVVRDNEASSIYAPPSLAAAVSSTAAAVKENLHSDSAILVSLRSCYAAMRSTIVTSMDKASKVIMYIISMLPAKVKLLDPDFFNEWRVIALKRHPSGPDVKVMPQPPKSLLSTYISTTFDTLVSKLPLLDPLYAKELICLCTKRLCLRVLMMIKEAASNNCKFTTNPNFQSAEFLQFSEDIKAIEDNFHNIIRKYVAIDPITDTYSLIATNIDSKVCACTHSYMKFNDNDVFLLLKRFLILVDSRQKAEFGLTLAGLMSEATKIPSVAPAISGFLTTCMNLRSDHQWSKKFSELVDTQTGASKARRKSVFTLSAEDKPLMAKDFENPIEVAIISTKENIMKQVGASSEISTLHNTFFAAFKPDEKEASTSPSNSAPTEKENLSKKIWKNFFLDLPSVQNTGP